MELYYSSNSDGYGDTQSNSNCLGAAFGTTGVNNASLLITTIAKDIGLSNGFGSGSTAPSLLCFATGETWAVSAMSSFLPGGKWCVDSNGISKTSDATSAGTCS